MNIKQSFSPLTNDDAEVLILGSIPGDRSIEMQQYYGHPQNRFWKVIAAITGSEIPINYADKKALLATNKIALWDVAQKASRKGSLDSAISNEEPNDIKTLITTHQALKTIAFNGKKAEQLYDRYFTREPHINYISLPSTSPANAACRLYDLCKIWKLIIAEK